MSILDAHLQLSVEGKLHACAAEFAAEIECLSAPIATARGVALVDAAAESVADPVAVPIANPITDPITLPV